MLGVRRVLFVGTQIAVGDYGTGVKKDKIGLNSEKSCLCGVESESYVKI